MKKFFLFLSVAVIGFSVTACSSGGAGNTPGRQNPPGGNDNNTSNYYVSSKAPQSPQSFRNINAVQLVSEIKLGWNLGNTFDASGLTWLGANPTVSQLERAWVGTVTTKANIDAIKNAGFNAIRIPVSWAKVANSSNYIIRNDWMDRITEVVNWAAENDMYIIINSHHDEDIFKFTSAEKAESLKAFGIIWGQIAVNFKNYNDKLIFEGLNEPRTKGSANEWGGGTSAEREILNEHYQVFIDTVRASGGNNDKRMLMVNTYAASAEQSALNGLVIPADTIANRIIVSVHSYSPYNFALSTNKTFNTWSSSVNADTSPITNMINRVDTAFVSKGIPVILGEFGAMNKDNEPARAQWAKFYVEKAMEKGMPCFWWDNAATTGTGELFGLLNRSNNQIMYPQIMNAMKEGVGIQ